jgi:hypothetical protein
VHTCSLSASAALAITSALVRIVSVPALYLGLSGAAVAATAAAAVAAVATAAVDAGCAANFVSPCSIHAHRTQGYMIWLV